MSRRLEMALPKGGPAHDAPSGVVKRRSVRCASSRRRTIARTSDMALRIRMADP